MNRAVVIKTNSGIYRNRSYYVQMRNGWEPSTSDHWAKRYARMIEQVHIPDISHKGPLTGAVIEHYQYWGFTLPYWQDYQF